MKKSLFLFMTGLSVAAMSAAGQGRISFNTYLANNSTGVEVTYGNGPMAGLGLDSTFTGWLLYSLTPQTYPFSPGWIVGATGKFGVGVPDGYVAGSDLVVDPYTLGTQVYFEIAAFNGTTYSTSTLAGVSGIFSQALAAGTALTWPADGNPSPTSGSGSGFVAPFALYTIPEPTSMALGSLGLASLLLFCRKQA